ncbi:hypothetical protein Q7P37_008255 [Cladosporium fusiforme]
MAYPNNQGFPLQTSLADELSKLISDSSTQNVISSVKLADGTVVQLNPQRRQCDICKTFLADDKSLRVHEAGCYSICQVHKSFGRVQPDGITMNGRAKDIERLTLDHVHNPTYDHSCYFVSGCRSRYRVASGWTNLDIVRHVIIDHSSMRPTEVNEMMMGPGQK